MGLKDQCSGSSAFSVTLLPLPGSHRKHFEFSHFSHAAAHNLQTVVGVLLLAPALGQKLGDGGTGVDEALQLLFRHSHWALAPIIEEKTEQDPCLAALPPQDRAMMEMAQAQQGGGTAVDPLLQDRSSDELRVLVDLDHRTHNASKDRDRERITAAGGYPAVRLIGADAADAYLGGGRGGADLA